jgi:hypothetical protein
LPCSAPPPRLRPPDPPAATARASWGVVEILPAPDSATDFSLQASATDALALPLRESGIRFCACPLRASERRTHQGPCQGLCWAWWRFCLLPISGTRMHTPAMRYDGSDHVSTGCRLPPEPRIGADPLLQ